MSFKMISNNNELIVKKKIIFKRKIVSDEYSAFLKQTNSIVSYDTCINRIKQLCKQLYSKEYFDINLIPNNEIIDEKIQLFSTDGVKARMAFTLYNILKFHNIDNKFIFDLGNKYYNSNNTNNIINEEKIIEYLDISKKRNEIINTFILLENKSDFKGRTMYLHCLLLSFYSTDTYRISNFDNVKFTDDGINNFINLDTCEITFRKYKTVDIYGIKSFSVHTYLIEFIKKYKDICFPDSPYLFPCINDFSISQTGGKSGSLTKFLYRMNMKYFGKSIGCNSIRKAKVSEELEHGASILTMISSADRAQHSISVRLQTYSKNSTKFNTDDPEYLSRLALRNKYPDDISENNLSLNII